MTRIMVVGDTHGNLKEALRLIDRAVLHKTEVIIVCGDFGVGWPGFEGVEFLDALNFKLRETNRRLVFVDGNHENFDYLHAAASQSPRSNNGHVYIRSHLLWTPRGNRWTWAGKRFMSVGGAVSIDRDYRLEYERKKGVKIWWEQEAITDDEVNSIISEEAIDRSRGKKVDYLFTHDCSEKTPWKHRLKTDFDSQINRQKMDKILNTVQPRMHFHGHMHEKYDWMNPTTGSGMIGDDSTVWTQTYGLECDGYFWNWGILDTETDSFTFAPNIKE